MRRVGLLLLLAGSAGGEDHATSEVDALLAELDALVASEREGGRGAEATALATEVLALRRRIADGGAPAPSADPEIHVVYAAGPARRGAAVRIEVRGRPVVLLLGSHGPISWNVASGAGVVQKIVTFGHPDRLVVAEPVVPVEKIRLDPVKEARDGLVRRIEDVTGGVVATLTEIEAGDPDTPVVLGSSNPEWLAQHLRADAVRLHWRATRPRRAALREELKRTRFPFLHRWREEKALRVSLCEWTPLGPLLARTTPLAPILGPSSALVVDEKRDEAYLLRAGARIRFPLPKGPPEVLSVPDALPRVEGACALAIDGRRDRLLLATRGGVGYLYALDLASRRWSVVCELDDVDAAGLAYDEQRDQIFVLEHGKDGRLTLERFSSEGQRLHATTLRMTSLQEPRPLAAACVHGRLVILYPPPDASPERAATDTLAFVVEPHTGDVIHQCRVRPWEDFEPLDANRIAELWGELLAGDGAAADRAVRLLAGQGDTAVAFIAERFTPERGTAEELGTWVRMLDDDDTLVRDLAQHRLVGAGARAEEFLAGLEIDALSPEARRRVRLALRQVEDPRRLERTLRAIRVLEAIDTPAAEALLRELGARGDPRRAFAAVSALRRIGAPLR